MNYKLLWDAIWDSSAGLLIYTVVLLSFFVSILYFLGLGVFLTLFLVAVFALILYDLRETYLHKVRREQNIHEWNKG